MGEIALASTHSLLATPSPLGDLAALQDWLSVYEIRSPKTARSYRHEAMKFRHFLEHMYPERRQSQGWAYLLRDAVETDVALYEKALSRDSDPRIPHSLMTFEADGSDGIRKGLFSRPLKQSSIDQALRVLNVMYEYLRTSSKAFPIPFVATNPVARVLRSRNRPKGQTARIVSREVISLMRKAIEEMEALAAQSASSLEQTRAARRRWIFVMLFGVWTRREELARLRMGDFVRIVDGWEVRLLRKGGNHQALPVSNWVMEELTRYRRSLGKTDLPTEDDRSPAIVPLRKSGRRTGMATVSAELIYQEIKALARDAADMIATGRAPGMDDEQRSFVITQLKNFSPHWFRHTGATIAIQDEWVTLLAASRMLGHTSVAITSSMYYHQDRDELRRGMDGLGRAA